MYCDDIVHLTDPLCGTVNHAIKANNRPTTKARHLNAAYRTENCCANDGLMPHMKIVRIVFSFCSSFAGLILFSGIDV